MPTQYLARYAEIEARDYLKVPLEDSFQHCLRHFHQWFDGFKVLKFMHGLRDQGYPDQSFGDLYPTARPLSPLQALQESRRRLGWQD